MDRSQRDRSEIGTWKAGVCQSLFLITLLERSKGSVAKQYTSLTFDISQLDITQYAHIENTSALGRIYKQLCSLAENTKE